MDAKHLTVVHQNLNTLLKAKADALPKGFNQTRFLQNCMTVLQDTKDIESVEPKSVARTMLKGAFLGLDFFNKECYAIVYNKKAGNSWIKTLEFQTDYKGEIKLAKKYSINTIKDIYAKLVREGDEFEEGVKDGKQVINFKPKPFNNNKILGAFAVAYYENGSMIYDTMSVEEIESVKKAYAKADKEGKYSKAWIESTGEMYKKTVLRRLCKLIELDFDTIEQKQAFDEGSGMEFKQEGKTDKPKSSLEAEFVEAEYEEVEESETSEVVEE
ncbi:recombination protein RecT [Anaerovirgula multivorans]|uniref:Recombination protein RecT n=1 Tax=Anaerovirgula multivorans TaxID=312168 RepID=A0A239AKW8_9FIRM|nr:RecT family recombinase [Anaerovirgula multivorans]SNR96021.1 recombination protein RecT [Anaerovirgula multivorans]